MLDAIASLFTLHWSQTPQLRPLPPEVSRSYVHTSGGELELLTSSPKVLDPRAPPVFFVHGGCGHASVWLEWMTYLHDAGYGGTLYSYSARNHGASYAVPYFRMVYRTSLDDMADDLVACVQAAREMGDGRDAVLVAHSSGGGLAQYALASGRLKGRTLCLLDAVPYFGNFCMYANWARHDPWILLRSLFHLQHPNSPLSSTKLVHGAFFCSSFPISAAQEFARWMPAYESMGWPMGMSGSFWGWLRGRAHWLDPRDILRNLSSVRERHKDVLCIMVGSKDMMLNAGIWEQQAAEMRNGLRQLQDIEPGDYKNFTKADSDGADDRGCNGVQLAVVRGAGHHLQNDLQRDAGAAVLLRFALQC